MTTDPAITAIIVTHNSPPVLLRVVEALLAQTLPPRKIAIVDSGSADPERVRALMALSGCISVTCHSNIGFAAGNNLAMREHLGSSDYFALVNPDAVLARDWLAGTMAFLGSSGGRGVGIVSSPLRGMDVNTEQPTGYWDSLGIYRHWSGRWFDRGAREKIDCHPAPEQPYEPIAICGALMLFSTNVYRAVTGPHGFFDERFHTYKEDIELSLRVCKAGYRLVMLPQLMSWHCRGWPKSRRHASYWSRKLSARNEIRIAARYAILLIPIYVCKYVYVSIVEPLLDWLADARAEK
jgi:GT2 family glycosyltransferase